MLSTTTRRAMLIAGLVAIAAACGLGAWILARGDGAFTVDAAWNDLLAGVRSSVLLALAQAMNVVGGGWVGVLVVPLAVAVALWVTRRPWAAAYFLAAEALSAALVQVLKHVFGRARPDDILVVSDYGSFPSGHTANAATLAVIAFALLPRAWVGVVGAAWVLLMAFSRTYLHAHWLSDTLGGALLGVGAALVLAAAFAAPLGREVERRRRGMLKPAARR
jgi:membrane-associated phospholipid phosphatase